MPYAIPVELQTNVTNITDVEDAIAVGGELELELEPEHLADVSQCWEGQGGQGGDFVETHILKIITESILKPN